MPEFEFTTDTHPRTGWEVLRLRCTQTGTGPGLTQIQLAPEQGCNLFSLRVDDVDYMVDLEEESGALKLLGTPILYPMPNRVRDGRFAFEGRDFTFPPNNGPNFIHGLVRDRAWQMDDAILSRDSASLTGRFRCRPASDAYALFPIANTLEVTFRLSPGAVQLYFAVHNDDTRWSLPFGLAIHPYFRIVGERRDVRVQAPATHRMEAVDLLPTGRLIELDGGERDLRQPRPLEGLDVDDVYWGMKPNQPQVIYYDALGKKLTLRASELFTHSVVYTPQGKPYLCMENQSCSTDAHNLYAQGLQDAAHLTVLEPGGSLCAWVDMEISEQ